ncbi:hypothetical protein ACHAWF_005189 [Thalassiosira exigua]
MSKGSAIFICYSDDGIALDINSKNLDNFVQELVDARFKVQDMGHLNDYMGVNIECQSDGTFHFIQTAVINQFIADCGLAKSTKKKQVPAKSSKIMSAHLDSPEFDRVSYCSVIDKLNYLAQTKCPDIMYPVNSCANTLLTPGRNMKQLSWTSSCTSSSRKFSGSSSSLILQRAPKTTSIPASMAT